MMAPSVTAESLSQTWFAQEPGYYLPSYAWSDTSGSSAFFTERYPETASDGLGLPTMGLGCVNYGYTNAPMMDAYGAWSAPVPEYDARFPQQDLGLGIVSGDADQFWNASLPSSTGSFQNCDDGYGFGQDGSFPVESVDALLASISIPTREPYFDPSLSPTFVYLLDGLK